MLLRFGVENMYSFRDYQEISLVIPKVSDQSTVRGVLRTPAIKAPVVPVAGIYGANASGKSNLLKCLEDFHTAIGVSHSNPGMPKRIRTPFLLNETAQKSSSRMDCDVIVDDIRYQYGFRMDHQRVLEEWLYGFSGSRSRILFHRTVAGEKPYYFGPSLKGNNRATQEMTRDDSLFISTAGINNHKGLTPLWEFLCGKIVLSHSPSQRDELFWPSLYLPCLSQSSQDEVVSFLQTADTGISGMYVKEASEQSKKDILAEMYVGRFGNMPAHEVTLEHQVVGGDIVLPFHLESRGTKTMLGLAVPVLMALKGGSLLVVDELESGLHPLAVKRVIELFQSDLHNRHGAQLLFSSHDTHLLENTLAAAQVWLCEKDSGGATKIFPLTTAQPRKEENLARGYLKGRYGGVPYMGSIEEVWGCQSLPQDGE